MNNNSFKPISKPYMYGVQAERSDGITVEVVRCYAGEWNVFLTRDDHVVARSVEQYRVCGDRYLPYQKAMSIARKLLA